MSKSFFKSLLLVIVLNLNFDYYKVNAQRSCRTTDGANGVCVPALSCNTITHLLEIFPQPLPESVSDYIRQSYCGTFKNVAHVCCETNRVNKGTTTATTTTTTRKPRRSKAPAFDTGVKVRSSSDESDTSGQIGMSILDNMKTLCGKSDADRIANGEDANLSEYPWLALLVYSDGENVTLECGGSLISDRYVLTAAHCIRTKSKGQLIRVRLGEHDKEQVIDCVGQGAARRCAPPLQEIDVEEAIYHKGFHWNGFTNDIGLLRLTSPAIFRSNVRPICLPITQRSMAVVLDRMLIAGWGKEETDVLATILQKAIVPIRPNDYCDKALRIVELNEYHLCAGGGSKKIHTCVGDSGGPMFYATPFLKGIRYVQFGVVSGGSRDCGVEYPSIFSNVKKFLPWIAANLRS